MVTDFSSVGGIEITAAPIHGQFDSAALGVTQEPTPVFAPQPTFSGPTGNIPGMSMDITMAPRGPKGLG